MTPDGRGSRGDGSPFRHSAAIYDTDDGFLGHVLPFVEDGLRDGEPVLVALGVDQQRLLASVIGDPVGVRVLAAGEHYAHPVRALHANRELFLEHLDAGADRVRVVGDVPRDRPSTWRSWSRYEALCNHHMTDLPVSALCTYDTRVTTAATLADVRRLHVLIARAGGQQLANPEYVEPGDFLLDWARATVDPLESGEPHLELDGPTPAEGRRAVVLAAAGTPVDTEGLVIAVSEALANAHLHGRPPVTLRAWGDRSRVVVTVTDSGTGPPDVFVGLAPPDLASTSGRGLWISHQVCDFFAVAADDGGCVARMIGEAPTP